VWGNLKTKRSGSRQAQHFVFDADDRLMVVKTESDLVPQKRIS
jgi:hypothetical protein